MNTPPALLRELDAALVTIERLDRERDHEAAHSVEDRLVLGVLAAVRDRTTNHRIMVRRLMNHLEKVQKYSIPRWGG